MRMQIYVSRERSAEQGLICSDSLILGARKVRYKKPETRRALIENDI